jgi:hypothetical protein
MSFFGVSLYIAHEDFHDLSLSRVWRRTNLKSFGSSVVDHREPRRKPAAPSC